MGVVAQRLDGNVLLRAVERNQLDGLFVERAHDAGVSAAKLRPGRAGSSYLDPTTGSAVATP